MEIGRKNPFAAGPIAEGDGFLGREESIRILEEALFENHGVKHLVGPPRIGKTSLVSAVFRRNRNRTDCIAVYHDMACDISARGFWTTLAEEILEQIEEAELEDRPLQKYVGKMNDALGQPEWYTCLQVPFRNICMRLEKLGRRLVLALDEFDNVRKLFGTESAYLQLLRSVYSMSVSGVVISRRSLSLLESYCPDLSTFKGIFHSMQLGPFSDSDMVQYWDLLNRCGIRVTGEGQRKLLYYTGRIPYLCSMLGSSMVERHLQTCGEAEIDSVFRDCRPQIDNEYYRDLIDRLTEDGHMEFVSCLALDIRPPRSSSRYQDDLKVMGILQQEETPDGEILLYAYTRDFMAYVREQKLRLPIWDTLMQSESKLKRIFGTVYPALAGVHRSDLAGGEQSASWQGLREACPGISLSWSTTHRYISAAGVRNPDVNVLNSLTLQFVIDATLRNWSRFAYYFGGDENWRYRLRKIGEIRCCVGHNGIAYIEDAELAECMQYCEALIGLETP